MALLNRSFVAKDSEGNIKKLSLEDILSDYTTLENVQELVEGAAPVAIDQARLSLSLPNMEAMPLEVPFSTSSVKLSTYAYSAEEPIYETEYQIEDRTFSRSDDAYKFVVNEENAPFGVLTDKKCFLVLSLPGLSSFSNTQLWLQSECREAGAVGGNPIVLDWDSVVLGEGGSYSFSYRDMSMPEGFGIYGKLQLSERQDQVGNVHWYSIRLEFTVCAAAAWNAVKEAYGLTLTTKNTAEEIETSTVDLSSLKYPQLAGVSVAKTNSALNTSGTEYAETFSSTSKTVLDFKAHRGIAMALEQDDPLDAATDRKIVSIGLDYEDVAGEGIVQDAEGRLSVPYFKAPDPEEGTTGSYGLVPAPQTNNEETILTTLGWTSLDDLGVPRNLAAFKGATYSEDGWQGLVPTPQVEDKDSFLRGDGTWVKAVSSITGNFHCDWQNAKKEHTFGFGVCNMNGDWIGRTTKVTYYLRPDSVEEYTVQLENVNPNEISGVSLCHPYTSAVPSIPEDRTNGWIADKILWSTDKTIPYIVHFADGTAAKAWLVLQDAETQVEIESDDPNAEPQYQTVVVTYAIMHLQVYGPTAVQPWTFKVRIDGTEVYDLASEAQHSEQMIFVAAGQGEACSMPSLHSMTYNYVPPIEEEQSSGGSGTPHEGHDPSVNQGQGMGGGRRILDIPEAEWIVLSDAEQEFANLHLTIAKDASHIRATGDEVSIAGWPQESAGAEMTFDYGYGNAVVPMSCLTSWLNERLEEIEANASVSVDDIPVFTGATEEEASNVGLVPPATSNDRTKFLAGDGRWTSILADPFTGAVEGDGTDGLVPAPSADDSNKFLKGDGTWDYPVQNFEAVEEVTASTVPAGTERTLAVDLESSLSNLNALLQAMPKIYVTTEKAVSNRPASGTNGVFVQFNSSEQMLTFGQYWNEAVDGEEDAYTEASETVSLQTLEGDSGEWTAYSKDGGTFAKLGATWDASSGTLQITLLQIWNEAVNVVGLDVVKVNTVTGASIEKTIDLQFIGATEGAGGLSGLVPRPTKEDIGKLLSANGSWVQIDATTLHCIGYQMTESDDDAAYTIVEGDSILTALSKLEGYLRGSSLSDRYVSLNGSQIITGQKTFASNTFAVPIEVENGQIDVSESSMFTMTVEDDTEIQFAGVPEGKSASFSLAIENGGSHNIQWPNNIQWVNGEPPSLQESGTDLLQFETWDGGQTWHVSGTTPMYQGATASEDGITGTIPPATAAERNLYLKGDGTWGTIQVYQGATASADAVTGTVPPATSAERDRYLKGDGTWSNEVVVTATEPTSSTPGTVFFYYIDE